VFVIVAFFALWFTMIRDSGGPAAVSLSFGSCANVGALRADGALWESEELAPAAWGDAEDGHLTIHGDTATFRSDSDGRTVEFQRIELSLMHCAIGTRP
jgi:hypothetical protein